jgi:hypothetical protein
VQNQPNQSINQLINSSTDQSINQSADQLINTLSEVKISPWEKFEAEDVSDNTVACDQPNRAERSKS